MIRTAWSAPRSPSRAVWLLAIAASLAACGGNPQQGGGEEEEDGGTVVPGNRPVGSNCASASDCASPGTPVCFETLAPLLGIPDSQIEDHSVYDQFANLGLTFPDGYCSSQPNCTSDAECGTGGACYAPFKAVETSILRTLEMTLKVKPNALSFLTTYGVCMRSCTASSQCEVGQQCSIPLDEFVSLVPGAVNETPYCIPCPSGSTDPNCVAAGTPTVPIGGACDSDSQCAVRGTARCLSEIHPLMDVVPPGQFLANIGLDFRRGYCSNEPNCTSNIQCGLGGKCLAPFRDVTEDTLRDLETTFDPDLPVGSLDFLGGYGVCLRSCTDNYECFSDQSCQVVMPEFISQVPGAVNTQTYCVPDEDCRYCDSHASCLANESSGKNECVCDPGYTGNGLVCSSTGSPACGESPCLNGGACSDKANGGYTCLCESGYSGTNCQIAVACRDNPCENGGICTPVDATHRTCDCPEGYSGDDCETQTTCPAFSAPSNGEVTYPTGRIVGGTAEFTCNQGYQRNGNASVTCQENGTWSGSAATCSPVSDPCSSNPCQNGGTCNVSGSTYSCACVNGYAQPNCATLANCGTITAPANGSVSYAPASTTTYGATASFTCSSGYALMGSASATCTAAGTWSNPTPTCMMVSTGNPCSPNPCNGGTCTAGSGSSYTCSNCPTGYSGMNCQTPASCGALTAPANGTVTTTSTTYNGVGTYTCNANYTLTGNATRTCGADGQWTGTTPTCTSVPTTCGMYTDVVYRLTGTFAIKGTTFGIGNQTFTGLTNNPTPSPFANTTNKTIFTGSSVTPQRFTRGFARLRFTNNASGTPVAGTVRLVEWYFPLEFTQTAGATLYANNDHSLGLINNPGSLANCGGSDAACANHVPVESRACASNATGSITGTALTWGACTNWTGANAWNYGNARAATGAGCATGYVQYGNNKTDSGLVPAAGKGDLYQVYNQKLTNLVFSSSNYLTASWTMGEIQIPNATGQSNTWLQITSATVIATDCGTTPGTDLICNVE